MSVQGGGYICMYGWMYEGKRVGVYPMDIAAWSVMVQTSDLSQTTPL